jgi:SAM-dependent methyltransferase
MSKLLEWLSALRSLRVLRRSLADRELEIRSLRSNIETQAAQIGQLHRELPEHVHRLRTELSSQMAKLEAATDQMSKRAGTEAQALHARLDRVAPRFPPLANLGSDDSAAWFYAGIEERFRGPRESIVQRLRIYLPFVEQLRATAAPVRALDLGCGRGEWIELLRGEAVEATGVDENPVIVNACVGRGLPVVRAEAFEYLRAQPEGAFDLVTSFHVIEHLPTETAVAWLLEIRRVLRPGGMLILETPNAENLMVGASTFYNDPTHRHPVPAELLRFIVEFARFDVVEILPLQPNEPMLDVARGEDWPPTLRELLGGPRDIGIVATAPSRNA